MTLDHRLQTVLWLSLGIALLWLLMLLGPVLTPFLVAGILAYICNPLVARLQRFRLPRVGAVLLVILLLVGLLVGVVLIVAPLMIREVGAVISRLPDAANLANERWLPWLRETLGIELSLDPASLKEFATENMDSLQTLAQRGFQSLKIGGVAVVGLLANLMLTPVVMFYLLVDWHNLLQRIERAIPRTWHERALRIARDVDAVLSEFLRGQVLVMLALAAYYIVALWLADIPSAFAIGLLTGLLIFIPYVGYATGFLLALLVALLQFAGIGPVIAVLAVYGIGQLIESFVLTPYLVGDRIGLHPLAVIFALMAFGQLFGFVGILLALPASAALLVALREVRSLYFGSRFYQGPNA